MNTTTATKISHQVTANAYGRAVEVTVDVGDGTPRRIVAEQREPMMEGTMGEPTINWSGIGSVSVDAARSYADGIEAAANIISGQLASYSNHELVALLLEQHHLATADLSNLPCGDQDAAADRREFLEGLLGRAPR